MKRLPPKPTASELEILHVLWNRGPSTVRDVLDALNEKKSLGYTGVLKLLQNMHAKGMVQRRQDGQAHIYEAREPARMKRQLLGELMQRVFAGSASQLVSAAYFAFWALSTRSYLPRLSEARVFAVISAIIASLSPCW